MSEHTTIQITKEQADELRARKTHDDESYKSVIARLLDRDNSAIDTEELIDAIAAEADGQGRVDDSELAREVARQLDYGELANAVADELEARRR
jgi:hypothetical protein